MSRWKSAGRIAAVAIAALLAWMAAVPIAASAAGTGAISGTVTDALTEAGIAGVSVVAGNEEAEEFADTDSNGEYTITNLPEGDYEVSFLTWPHALDYVDQTYSDKAWWQWASADVVHVSAEATTTEIDAHLQLGGQITGTVTRAAEEASLGEIRVCAHAFHDPEWFMEYECARSDGTGHYALRGLGTGSYKVEFSPTWEGEDDDGFPAQFYGGSDTLAGGAWVSVVAPDAVSGIDGHLAPLPAPTPEVSAGTPPQPQPIAPPVPQPQPKLGTAIAGPAVVARGSVVVDLRCRGGARCRGVARLLAEPKQKHRQAERRAGAGRLLIGKSRFSVAAGHHAKIVIKLTGKGKRLLAQAGRSGLKVRLMGTGIKPRVMRLKG
jgi:hypothetical protein